VRFSFLTLTLSARRFAPRLASPKPEGLGCVIVPLRARQHPLRVPFDHLLGEIYAAPTKVVPGVETVLLVEHLQI